MQQPIHPRSPSPLPSAHRLTTSSGGEAAEAQQRQLHRSAPRLAAAAIFSLGEAVVGPADPPILLLPRRHRAALGGAAAAAAHQRQQGESRQPLPLAC